VRLMCFVGSLKSADALLARRREPKVKKVENPKFKEEEEAVSGQ
jgi:hypothetical protein